MRRTVHDIDNQMQMVSGKTSSLIQGIFYLAMFCYNSFLLYAMLGVRVKMPAPPLFSAFQ